MLDCTNRIPLRHVRRIAAAAICVAVLFALAKAVSADGGKGGDVGSQVGGAGGTGSTGEAGGVGAFVAGGGGGGAGGGVGGKGGGAFGGLGGAAGADGGNALPNTGSGGGGGGGGLNGNGAGDPTLNNAGTLTGGNGGKGGNAPTVIPNFGGGGGGGAGGYGAVVTGAGASDNSGSVTGGNGGAGGNSSSNSLTWGGNGGDGGHGVFFSASGATFTNSGSIFGGVGGAEGGTISVGKPGVAGLGGVGIVGADLTIINTGSITGGMSGDASPVQANAIWFTSGINRLEIWAGSTISGNVVGDGTSDTLTLGGTTDATFDVSQMGTQFIDFEALTTTGGSTWTLVGASNSFAGLTTVSAGQLVVNGSLASSTFNIDGGWLGGSGTVGSLNVNAAGIVAPGNSTGALHVAGDYLQSGAYYAEINAAGDSDLIAVSETATLGAASTLSVLAAPGNYVAGTQYTILTAGGGVTGQFGTVIDDLPLMDVGVLYGTNEVILVLTTNQTQFSSLATTFNQLQVAHVLDGYQPAAGGDLGLLIDQLQLQNTAGVQYGLQSLDAELFGSTATLVIEKTDLYLRTNVNYLRQRSGLSAGSRSFTSFATVSESSAMTGMVADQLAPPPEIQLASYHQPSRTGSSAAATGTSTTPATAPGSPARCGCQTCGGGCNGPLTSGWVQGIGAGGDVNGNGNAVGLNYGIGATAFGVDWQFDDTLIGLSGGYSHLNVDQQQGLGSNQVDSLQCSLYGLQRLDDWYVLGLTGYASDDFESRRNIYLGGMNPTAIGNYRGDEFFAYLETGGNIPLDGFDLPGGCWNLQPIAGLRYLLLNQQGFIETEAGIANLAVAGDTFDSLRYSLGARLCQTNETEWGYWAPYVQARWVHEMLDNERLINAGFAGVLGGSFVSQGNVLGRDFGEFGLGTTTNLCRNLDLYVGYDLQVSTRQSAHGGACGLQFLW